MMIRRISIVFLTLSFFIISACGNQEDARDVEYESTKKMVVDILQTEEGKKVLKDLLKDEELKELLVMDSEQVKSAVNTALTSEEGRHNWEQMFQDTEFVQTYAKSISDEQKKLMKELMHDSEFQKQMIEILNNPEVNEQILSVVKSQAFRAHLEKTIQETMQSPLFQAKVEEILKKEAEKMTSEGGSGGENQNDGQSSNQNDGGESNEGGN